MDPAFSVQEIERKLLIPIGKEILILAKTLIKAGEIRTAKELIAMLEGTVIISSDEIKPEWELCQKAVDRLVTALKDVSDEYFGLEAREDDDEVNDFIELSRMIGDRKMTPSMADRYLATCWGIYLSHDLIGKMIASMSRMHKSNITIFLDAYLKFIEPYSELDEMILRIFTHKSVLENIELDMDLINDANANKLNIDIDDIDFNLPRLLSSPASSLM